MKLCVHRPMVYRHLYIQTYIFIGKIMVMLMNAKWYPVHTAPPPPVSTTLLRRWYYVNVVLTTLVLRRPGSYYVVTRSLPRSLALRKF